MSDPIASSHSTIEKSQGKVLIASLKQIALISKEGDLNRFKSDEHTGVQAYNVRVPGGIAGLSHLLDPFLNRPLTEEGIKQIIGVISQYYIKHYYPMVAIEVPKQDIAEGMLQLVVIESRMGEVLIQDDRSRSCPILANYMNMRQGDSINERSILKGVDFINRNPFRRADVVYAPGKEPYTTDVIVHVEERRPFRFYSGADNTGVGSTGRQRWYLGFNSSYLFGQDIQFAYQFTASTQFHRFWSQTAQAQLLFPWKHVLNIYGGYSAVHVKTKVQDFTNHGNSYQASGRYTLPLNPTRNLRHETGVGFDFKRTNNTILYTENVFFFGKNVNLTQLVGRYIGNYEGKIYRLDFDLEGYWSPGKWIADQTNGDFSSIRPGAKNRWVYVRGGLNWNQQIGNGFWFASQIRAQLSSGNLLPSEQLGIGGYDTVRGYDERELNEDSGLILNFEIHFPHFRFFTLLESLGKTKERLQFLVFIDYGSGTNHKTLPDQSKTEYLVGIGPGMRYTIDPYLAVRLDYGLKLHKSEAFTGSSLGKLHFSAVLSY